MLRFRWRSALTGRAVASRLQNERWQRAVLVDEAGQDIRGRDLACARQSVDVGCAQKATFAKPVFRPSLWPRILGQHLGSYIVKSPPVGAGGRGKA